MAVLARADDAVEERLLVAADHVVLDRVVVEEVVRALDQRHSLVVEVADHRVERVGHRHVVGVEHQHQLALGARQRGVDVAGLGVRVVGAGQVARAGQLRQLLHLRPPAVVEQVGRVGIGERAAAGQRRHHHLDRLVVGADVDVDRASRRGRRPHRRRAATTRTRPASPAPRGRRPRSPAASRRGPGWPPRRSSRPARSGSRPPRAAPGSRGRAAARDGDRRTARLGSARRRARSSIGVSPSGS